MGSLQHFWKYKRTEKKHREIHEITNDMARECGIPIQYFCYTHFDWLDGRNRIKDARSGNLSSVFAQILSTVSNLKKIITSESRIYVHKNHPELVFGTVHPSKTPYYGLRIEIYFPPKRCRSTFTFLL